MRHVYRCPLRWADLDAFGHINNVVYVDYLQEARVDMFRLHSPGSRSPEGGEGLVVVRHDVSYVTPLHFRAEPVSIECWVTEIRAASFTMAYEIFDETPAGRVVYLRASTVLTPFVFSSERPRRLRDDEKAVLTRFLEPAEPVTSLPFARGIGAEVHDSSHACPVRFSDVDAYGHVNNVEYFTYLQEARITLIGEFGPSLMSNPDLLLVVAQAGLEYYRPMTLQPEPYSAVSRLTRVGSTSFWIDTEITDGETVYARGRVVMVFFDTRSERATAPPAGIRTAMLNVLSEQA